MTETADRPIRKFNPGTLQSDEEVVAQFVVRSHELDIVLEVLRGNVQSPSCQHVLIVAPRGRGKTMLLARAAAELRTNDEFSSHLLPVRFMEESQEIFNLADFWLETLFHLARECMAHDSGLARELHETHAALSERWREQALEEHARAAILDAADRLDRKLVLMVENLQTLCKDVDADFGWKLRGVLQTEPQIVLLASATGRFEGLDDAEQPFFEMLRIIDLKPLITEECRRLWQVVSGDTVSGRGMRPLEILTGGSPRLLVIVAGFARHKSMRRLMEELVTLIDEHTEYFRGHLEVLGKTERRVYVAVLDLWQLSTPGEIAARARMDVRVVSTMLGRLVDRGAVTVEGSGRKRQYAAAERLYSIYYKLRRERDEATVVENLIRFMAVFYSEAEQTEMFTMLILEAEESPAIRHGLGRAAAGIPELDKFFANMLRPSLEEERPDEVKLSGRAAAGDLTVRASLTVTDHRLGERLLTEISKAFEEKAFEKVIEIVDQAFYSQGTESSQVSAPSVVWALHMKAGAHLQLGDREAAVSTCEEVMERFGTSEDPALQRCVAGALNLKVHACHELGDLEAAVSACEEVVERFGTSEDPALQRCVAGALVLKGHTCRELDDLEAAVSAGEEVVERFGATEDPELRRCVTMVLTYKTVMQTGIGHVEDALRTCDELERRLGILDGEEKSELTWLTMLLRTWALLVQGNLRVAMDTFRSLYGVFVPRNETMMQEVLRLVPDLVAAGSSAHDLVEILSSDAAKAATLTPLLVALRQHAGETVRAPTEVLEVASDIRERMMAKGATHSQRTMENSPIRRPTTP